MFGGGASFTVEELPEGKLKKGLDELDAESRSKAMEWLHGLQFDEADAAGHLRVDRDGGVFIVCPEAGECAAGCLHDHPEHQDPLEDPNSIKLAGEDAESSGDGPPGVSAAPVPVSSPPAYDSRPGATRHIYLDFNGAYVTGKAWTATDNTTTWDTWDCAAWDTDGNPASFSDTEQANIRRIWERVAEDYAPFDVNVTTNVIYDPEYTGPDAYTGSRNNVGWLLTTPTTDKNGARCPHFGSGGVAYVGVFGRNDYFSNYQPAWVTPMSTANIAEAASHEMGHNLGLSHDGTSGLEYYGGHPGTSSAPSWGPIMGTGYGRNVSQWSKASEYFDGNRTQDDLVIISNRVGYRPDDHGTDFAGATVLIDGAVNKSGVIETTGEADYFRFTTAAGTVDFQAAAFRSDSGTWGANLDIVIELYDDGFNLVTSANPPADTDASISTSVPAGTYYVVVRPTGAGDPLSDPRSGYTAYGSLGQYSLTGSYIPPDDVLVVSPNGGESFLFGQTREIVWASGLAGNVRIELHKGGALHSLLSASEANDGSFDWTISPGLPLGTDYRIRISSVDQPAIEDFSDADFAIAEEIFPPSGTMPPGWMTSIDADVGWEVTGDQASEGDLSLRNFDIDDSQLAAIEYTANFLAGTVSFDLKVSSESNWDYARFYIDGVQQLAVSGEVDWQNHTFPLSAGLHTLKWVYQKDSSVSSGSDTVWIDAVALPAETSPMPDIAVEDPDGADLLDGVASVSIGSPAVGVGVSKTFTIRNAGNAPLSGLSVSIDGAHSDDFVASSPLQTTLAPGASTTFEVIFTPAATTPRSAMLHVASNDFDENPFDIALYGILRVLIEEEGFESGLGGWAHSSGNDFNWARNSGGTGSSGTGPAGASEGSWYLYTEASAPNHPSKTAAIEREIDLGGISNAALIFDYHMYGEAMGTLNLDVFDGASWQTAVWSRSGQQHASDTSAWSTAEVDLSAYDGTPGVRLRFRGLTGSSFTSDMAIDDVELHGLLAEYSLTYTPGEGGALSGSVSQTVSHGADGDPVEAIPDPNFRFVGWSDGSTANPRIDEAVTSDISVVANFEPNLPPNFSGYAIAVDEEGSAPISLVKLLAGVSDPEGHGFGVTAAGPGSVQGGVVTLGESAITYEAPIGVSGPDSFQVTVSDEFGASTTAPVSVTIRPAAGDGSSHTRNPASVTMNGSNDAEVRFWGIPGREYRVQRSTDLSNWQDIATVTAASNGQVFHTDADPPHPNAYYRLAR